MLHKKDVHKTNLIKACRRYSENELKRDFAIFGHQQQGNLQILLLNKIHAATSPVWNLEPYYVVNVLEMSTKGTKSCKFCLCPTCETIARRTDKQIKSWPQNKNPKNGIGIRPPDCPIGCPLKAAEAGSYLTYLTLFCFQ